MVEYPPNQDREEELDNIREDSSNLFWTLSAGLGAVGLGAAIFRNRVGSLVSDTLHLLGHPSRVGLTAQIDKLANVGKSRAANGSIGTRSVEAMAYDISKGQLSTGPIDLIDDLRNSVDILASNAITGDARKHFVARTQEYINREQASISAFSNFFSRDLKRVTVSEVLANQKQWSQIIGTEGMTVLQKARAEGLVTKDTLLDKNIFLTKKNQLRDTRLSRLFYVDPVGKNSSLFGKLTGGVNFFGQASVFKSVMGSKTGVAILDPIKIRDEAGKVIDSKTPRFFIGGDVFAYSKEGNPVLLAKNQKLRLKGDPLEDVTGVRQGWKSISKRRVSKFYDKNEGLYVPGFLKGSVKRSEISTGVGFAFATRMSLLQRWIGAPISRMKALSSGKGVIYKHAYRMDQSSSKIADAMLGAEYPELIQRHGVPIEVPGGRTSVDFKDLGFFKRLGVIFDLASDYSVIKSESYRGKLKNPATTLTNLDLVVPVPEGGLKTTAPTLPSNLASKIPHLKRPSVTKVGDVLNSYQSRYYDVESSKVLRGTTPLRDVMNYMFYRVNTLSSESLLGVGFTPSKNILGTMTKLASIPFFYEGVRQAYEYTDYKIEDLTGYSPTKVAADIYTSLRLGQQSLRETLGIQQTAKALEENYPGSIDSEGFSLLRSAGLPLAGLSLGLKFAGPKIAAGIAGALYSLFGGPGLTQTREELEKEYSGETKVPVRKGAWWSLGFQGLFGERPKYYDSSWYHKLKTDSYYKGMYGSKEEYFKYHQNIFGIPFFSPDNLAGLRYIANPYRFEEINYDSRPYIQTGSNLQAFPIFGPALASIFGKTTRYRTPDQLPLLDTDVVDKGLDPQTAKMLGIPDVAASAVQLEDPSDPLIRLRKQADIALEPMGIYKFALNFFGVELGPNNAQRMASSNLVTAAGRELYQANLGGALGQTEFIRRFMLTEYSSAYALSQLYNPIPNTAPDWLPGTRSSNKRDQSYFIDFHTGDPVAKIERGETRLPGAGYEALNELHSGKSGVYDDVDKFLILADIAPWSDAYRKLEAKLRYIPLEPEWRAKVERAKEQKERVTSVDNRYPRYFDQTVSDIINLNQNIKDSSLYVASRKAYDFITHDILTEIPYVGAKLFPFRDPFEQYRKLHVEGSEYADWNRPYEGVIRPAFYDMYYEDPLTATAKGAFLGFLASGPMRYFMPLKGVQAGAGAPSLGIFEYNAKTALAFAGVGGIASTSRLLQGESELGIPDFTEKHSQFTEYMDKFKYLKFGVLAEEAISQGREDLVSQFTRQQRKTLVGANNPIMLKASLPTSSDKRFFQYAMDAPLPMRDKILAGTPDYFSKALETAYSRDYPSKDLVQERVADYFSNNSIISTDSIDWHPSIPVEATKFRLVQHGINGISDNMHKYGFFESHKNEIQNRFPYLLDNQPSFSAPFNQMSYADMISTLQSDIKFKGKYFTPNGAYVQMVQTLDRTNVTTQYVNDYMRR